MTGGLSHLVGSDTSVVQIRYDSAHETDWRSDTLTTRRRGYNHKYCKVRSWSKYNEWFTIDTVGLMDDECVHLYITGIKDRWIYYTVKDGMSFIKHLLGHAKEAKLNAITGLKECFPDCTHCKATGYINEADCPVCKTHGIVPNTELYGDGRRRRRLVEAAYYSFIGFNLILACALLVGICFAYRIGTHEAKYEHIRW